MILREAVATQPRIPRIDLMQGKVPNPEVVKKMSSREYRLEVLKQMIEQRFLTSKIDVQNGAELGKLDTKIVSLIQDSFGNAVVGTEQAHQLYLELCYNQSLLDRAIAALKTQKQKIL